MLFYCLLLFFCSLANSNFFIMQNRFSQCLAFYSITIHTWVPTFNCDEGFCTLNSFVRMIFCLDRLISIVLLHVQLFERYWSIWVFVEFLTFFAVLSFSCDFHFSSECNLFFFSSYALGTLFLLSMSLMLYSLNCV